MRQRYLYPPRVGVLGHIIERLLQQTVEVQGNLIGELAYLFATVVNGEAGSVCKVAAARGPRRGARRGGR
jgi:hypothetical protein